MNEYYLETPDGLVIRGAVDDRQMIALFTLWQQWTEEEGQEFKVQAWAEYMFGMIKTGHYTPLVVYDGDTPVGMVECSWTIDPFDGTKHGFGDHAYVIKAYRRTTLFAQLVDACMEVSDTWETAHQTLPVDMDVEFLMKVYERKGFRLSGFLMTRKQ